MEVHDKITLMITNFIKMCEGKVSKSHVIVKTAFIYKRFSIYEPGNENIQLSEMLKIIHEGRQDI